MKEAKIIKKQVEKKNMKGYILPISSSNFPISKRKIIKKKKRKS